MHRGRCLLPALLTLLLCLALPGSRTAVLAAPAAPMRVPGMVRLPGHVPAAAVARAQALGRVPAGQTMRLALSLPLRDPAGLDSFLERLYNPADPLYRHYLKPGEFAERFGPTQQSYDAVVAFARAHGLAVTYTSPARVLLSVSGPAAAVESAFALRLGRYQAPDGRVFHAPDSDPAIPVSLVGRLSGVIGLDDAHPLHPYLRRQASALRGTVKPLLKGIKAATLKPAGVGAPAAEIGSDPNTGALQPSDVRAAYNLSATTLDGSGQTLALYELDGYNPGDIAAYESAYNLRPVPLQNILVGSADGTIHDPNGGGEVTLDIEVMAALAPGATKILVYEGLNGTVDQVTLYQKIADDDLANQVSTSWGNPETDFDQTTLAAENTAFKQMATQLQSIYGAAGDKGAYDNGAPPGVSAPNAGLSVDDPASQPYMVGVGGTTLAVTKPGGGYQSESAWGTPSDTQGSSFGAGGGGGVSVIWPIPSYQVGVPGLYNNGVRNVPDVSLDADPNTGYAFFYGGQWGIVGGTSVAAPLWAAFTALVNQQRAVYGYKPFGFASATLYNFVIPGDPSAAKYSSAFHDVADGTTNLFYPTKTGYDNATGLGSYNGANLLAVLAPPPNTTGSAITSLSFTPNPVVGGLTVTGTVTLANPAPAGGATVTLTSNDAKTAPVPANVVVPAGQTSATFPVVTAVTAGTTVTVTASYLGSSAAAGLIVQPSPTAVVPSSLSFNPPSVNGGVSSQGTVTLTGAAPQGGLVIALSSSDPAVQVPATVTVPVGNTAATFTATTSVAPQQVNATVTASAGGVSAAATLTVLAPTLEKLLLTPARLPGGQKSTGTLTLTLPAAAAGAVIALSSDNPAAQVPATATIPAAGTTTTFTITTSAVPTTVTAKIRATFAGLTQSADLTIQSARIAAVSVAPASLTGGAPAVGTVTLDSPVAVPAGLAVSLASGAPAGTVPASVLVPVGATTATFPVTTAVVLAPVTDTLTATLDGISKTTPLSIQPIQVTSLTLSPPAVVAGIPSVATVTVNAPAPPAGLTVALSQTGTAETLPATATVPAGATTTTFTIGTPLSGTATIAAVVGGQTRTATLTVTTAVGTSFPAGLNMISVPYDYSGQALDGLFGYTGVRLATWDGTISQYALTPTAPADALRLGRSYFVRLPKAVTLSSVGTPADPTTDFSIPLLPGWSMIGDPFLVPVALSATHVSSGGVVTPFSSAVSAAPLLLSSLLYGFSPAANKGVGGYVTLQTSGSLQPGQGYWVYAYSAVTLVIPHPGQ